MVKQNMNKDTMIVAIDGPCGSGKSTIGKLVAKELNYLYIDTGAMYRCVALLVVENQIDISDDVALLNVLSEIQIQLKVVDQQNRVILNQRDVTDLIRQNEISKAASAVAQNSKIREHLVAIQRRMVTGELGVVLDGRDVATVVFPQAQVKIFLTAEEKIRATRRFEQLKLKGKPVAFEKLLKEIADRDQTDQMRALAPLKKHEDATLVDNSEMTIDETVKYLTSLVEKKEVNND